MAFFVMNDTSLPCLKLLIKEDITSFKKFPMEEEVKPLCYHVVLISSLASIFDSSISRFTVFSKKSRFLLKCFSLLLCYKSRLFSISNWPLWNTAVGISHAKPKPHLDKLIRQYYSLLENFKRFSSLGLFLWPQYRYKFITRN